MHLLFDIKLPSLGLFYKSLVKRARPSNGTTALWPKLDHIDQ